MDPKNNEINLDDAIRAMKQAEPTPDQARCASARVYSSLKTEPAAGIPGRIRTGADYSALLQPYLRNELTEAQRMLVDDQLASNPNYRRELDGLRGNVREMAPARARQSSARTFVPWAVAAGLLITTGYFALDSIDRFMAPSGPRAEIASVSGEIFKVSAAGLEPMKPGETIPEAQPVRTAKGSSAIVRLPDGSLIEMNERAELSISAAYSGSTIRLDRGNILVQAAKQKRGALKVATRESTVSVKGTIFSVAAGLRGTQVAVVEGHVVVEQGGKSEDLLPGQSTGSIATLKRTSVPEQIAWSKDSARYLAMLGELSQISKQIEALPQPSLRSSSRLTQYLPSGTVVYIAIPNITGTVADATRIFEDRLKQSPVLQEWWNTKQVSEARDLAEKLRSAGSQIGDEIVIAASLNSTNGLGHPVVLAEVKGNSARTALEAQLRELPAGAKSFDHIFLSDRFFAAGDATALARTRASFEASANGGFEATPLAATVKQSYAKGAGWILAVDLEQIFAQSVSRKSGMNHTSHMNLIGINSVRHLMVERRDIAGRADMRASVSFSAPRTGIASWLALPAPMPSLDYISPEATFAMSAVTKNARQMAEEFFAVMGSTEGAIGQIEKEIGINVLDDLAGPLGGEMTLAIDGPLLPVPTYIFATEVYDAARLTSTLHRVADAFNKHSAGTTSGTVNFAEQSNNGRTWYTLKHSAMPIEMNFTYSGGYMVAAASRDTILKALQTRNAMLSLPRSQRFRELLPADAQVNASAVFYFNVGNSLESAAAVMKDSLKLSDAQKQAIETFTANNGPVLITAYAGPDSITVASSSGFFGFGLDSLLAAGKGAPILPQILSSALGLSSRLHKPKVQ